jgi:hypothetical protein
MIVWNILDNLALIKKMILYIHGMYNEKYTLEVCENENDFKNYTIKNLKQKLINEKMLSIGVEELRLIYVGKQLDDEKTLKDYNIDDKSTLISVVRVHGGKF